MFSAEKCINPLQNQDNPPHPIPKMHITPHSHRQTLKVFEPNSIGQKVTCVRQIYVYINTALFGVDEMTIPSLYPQCNGAAL